MKNLMVKKQEMSIIDDESIFIIKIDRIHDYIYISKSDISYFLKDNLLFLEIKNEEKIKKYELSMDKVNLEILKKLKKIIIIESSMKLGDINYIAKNSIFI